MSAVKPRRLRRGSKPFLLITRKHSRFISVKLRGGKARTTRQTTTAEAKEFAHRLIGQTR